MVRILVLKHLYNLSDEQAEYQLLPPTENGGADENLDY